MNTATSTPTNSVGHHIEAYTDALGWKPCTHPVATREEAEELLTKFDRKTHRVYHALTGYTLADQKA
jgi:hypothetical protein